MKKFVIGDIHGAHKALIQCLERSNFNIQEDQLIVLGDICDGWSYVQDCVNEILKITNLVYVMGNHDYWFLDYIRYGKCENLWLNQGGRQTLESYHGKIPESHFHLFRTSPFYYEQNNNIFVHGGFSLSKPIQYQDHQYIMWDRDLYSIAVKKDKIGLERLYSPYPETYEYPYNEIYVGHTQYKNDKIQYCNLYNLDTGAGWNGVLTIMNIETKETFKSDNVLSLYPYDFNRRI